MFLVLLSTSEKQAFLCLANKVIKADGIIAEKEMILLNNLCNEMGTPNLVSNLNEDESFTVFASSEGTIKYCEGNV
jgi:hypothetical protein